MGQIFYGKVHPPASGETQQRSLHLHLLCKSGLGAKQDAAEKQIYSRCKYAHGIMTVKKSVASSALKKNAREVLSFVEEHHHFCPWHSLFLPRHDEARRRCRT
jgi:hypothetical protein